jgi:hypothetical protein
MYFLAAIVALYGTGLSLDPAKKKYYGGVPKNSKIHVFFGQKSRG